MRIRQNFRLQKKLELNIISDQEVTKVNTDAVNRAAVATIELSKVQPIEILNAGIYPIEESHAESFLDNY